MRYLIVTLLLIGMGMAQQVFVPTNVPTTLEMIFFKIKVFFYDALGMHEKAANEYANMATRMADIAMQCLTERQRLLTSFLAGEINESYFTSAIAELNRECAKWLSEYAKYELAARERLNKTRPEFAERIRARLKMESQNIINVKRQQSKLEQECVMRMRYPMNISMPYQPICGNGICEPPFENVYNCPEDCKPSPRMPAVPSPAVPKPGRPFSCKVEGEPCENNYECCEGYICVFGTCRAMKKPSKGLCPSC